jgi:hypothetical protein
MMVGMGCFYITGGRTEGKERRRDFLAFCSLLIECAMVVDKWWSCKVLIALFIKSCRLTSRLSFENLPALVPTTRLKRAGV